VIRFTSTFLIILTAAACGGSSGDDSGGGGGGVDAGLTSGTHVVPLSTPTGQEQGSFYSPTMTASGGMFLLDLDTGSTVTGITGACSTCGGLSPVYTPGSSAMDTGRPDSAEYADGTGWSGEIYSDSVGLPGGTPDVTLKLVDINTQMSQGGFGFFDGNSYQGILGMGPDELLDPGTTGYPTLLTAAGVNDIQAYELCPTNGTMWLGGYDASHANGDIQYTTIQKSGDNNGFYAVPMTAMGLGSTDLGATRSTLDGPIVDTGTSLFYIPTAADTKLLATLNADAGFKALFPSQTMQDGECATAAAGTTDAMVDAMLPPMTETFDGITGEQPFTLSAPALASYLQSAGQLTYCMVVESGGDQGEATMGDAFMRGFVTVIDRKAGQVGFAPSAHCPAAEVEGPTGVARGPMREHGRGPHHTHRTR
jgi:hypothetical protein